MINVRHTYRMPDVLWLGNIRCRTGYLCLKQVCYRPKPRQVFIVGYISVHSAEHRSGLLPELDGSVLQMCECVSDVDAYLSPSEATVVQAPVI